MNKLNYAAYIFAGVLHRDQWENPIRNAMWLFECGSGWQIFCGDGLAAPNVWTVAEILYIWLNVISKWDVGTVVNICLDAKVNYGTVIIRQIN